MSRPLTDPRRSAYRGARWFAEATEDRLLAWDALNAVLSGQSEQDFVSEKTLSRAQAGVLETVVP